MRTDAETTRKRTLDRRLRSPGLAYFAIYHSPCVYVTFYHIHGGMGVTRI
jgi:hypothetical protein